MLLYWTLFHWTATIFLVSQFMFLFKNSAKTDSSQTVSSLM